MGRKGTAAAIDRVRTMLAYFRRTHLALTRMHYPYFSHFWRILILAIDSRQAVFPENETVSYND